MRYKYKRSPTKLEIEVKKIKELIEKKKLSIEQEEFVLTILEKHLRKLQYQKGLKIGCSF